MNQTICAAIGQKKVIRFFYDGGFRQAEPHCYGVGRNGNELLRAFQVGGHSESGQEMGWKLFRAGEMSNLSLMDQSFSGPRPQYNPSDTVMATIYCAL